MLPSLQGAHVRFPRGTRTLSQGCAVECSTTALVVVVARTVTVMKMKEFAGRLATARKQMKDAGQVLK